MWRYTSDEPSKLMSLTREALKQTMSSKTDEELFDALYVHRAEYTADAVEVAEQEFLTRKLEVPAPITIDAAVDSLRQREEAPWDGLLE